MNPIARSSFLALPLPEQVYEKGKHASEFFTRQGELRHIKRLKFWPLDKVFTEKYHMDSREVRRWGTRGLLSSQPGGVHALGTRGPFREEGHSRAPQGRASVAGPCSRVAALHPQNAPAPPAFLRRPRQP